MARKKRAKKAAKKSVGRARVMKAKGGLRGRKPSKSVSTRGGYRKR